MISLIEKKNYYGIITELFTFMRFLTFNRASTLKFNDG